MHFRRRRRCGKNNELKARKLERCKTAKDPTQLIVINLHARDKLNILIFDLNPAILFATSVFELASWSFERYQENVSLTI